MKTLTYILLLTFCYSAQGQVIGEKLNNFLKKDKEIGVTHYAMKNDYFYVIAATDSLTKLFIFDYDHEKLIGIDYAYEEESLKIDALKSLTEGFYPYGEGVWMKDRLIIVEKYCLIQIRDVKIRDRRIQVVSRKQ
jgi:hypothetical protein